MTTDDSPGLGEVPEPNSTIDAHEAFWYAAEGRDRVAAVALHDGHFVREELRERLAISPTDRRREEDPYTGSWAAVAATHLVGCRSRFEVDLNRPREQAVYLRPEDAWGLDIWAAVPTNDMVARSLALYDAFYAEAAVVIERLLATHPAIVILDLHSYNHRRDGPGCPAADAEGNPEVNLGTGSVDHECFGPLVERFASDLHNYGFPGRHLDVRENVKFLGGHFARWTHATFPGRVCTLAVEFKKFFMDEWSGEPDDVALREIPAAVAATLPGLRESLARVRQVTHEATG